MKKQNRKNNKTPYLVVTLACALLVLGLGGNTLAKYVTEKEVVSQTATVAKWGYVINVSDGELFGSKYDETGKINDSGVSVVSSTTGLVVAPGTNGSISFSVKGQAEVLSKLTFEASGSDVHYGEYYPIKWTLTEVDNVNSDDLSLTGKKLSEVVTALKAESKASVAANTKIDSSYTLTWEWALSQGHDDYDTYLGNAASDVADSDKGTGTAHTTVSFSLNIAAEQIQG